MLPHHCPYQISTSYTLRLPRYGPGKISKVKVTTARSKVRSRSHYDNAHLHPLTNVPTKYRPLWVRGCRIGPTYPPACHKRRLIGGSLFAVGCNPCQWKRGSWLLSQFFVAALRRQYTALASISLSRKVKMAWLNQSAGSAKP